MPNAARPAPGSVAAPQQGASALSGNSAANDAVVGTFVPGEVVPPAGDRSIAAVTVGGRKVSLVPDQAGDFPRVLLDPGAVVSVQVNFPDGSPGDAVAIEEEDGGTLDEHDQGKALALDDSQNIHFTFHANTERGIYRVLLRNGGDARMLNFWVGPEMPMAAR